MIDPLHQFMVHPLIPLSLLGYDISFTNASLFMVLTVLAVCLLFYFGVRPHSIIPGRVQIVLEGIYQFVIDMIQTNIGHKGRLYFPYIFTLFMFIATGNLIGLAPYSFTFTSHIVVTFALALIVFMAVLTIGVVQHRSKFLSLFVPQGVPVYLLPLLVPIEILSYLARPVTLAIRLFANMVAGHAMLKVFAGFSLALGGTWLFPVALLPILFNVVFLGFKVFVALLQAYVFTILTCLYLNDSINLHY
jgi:F-type H+-transporting ATPase subunit a